MLPSPADIRAAAERLRDVVVRTPLVPSHALGTTAGMDVHFKCEHLQRTGSFKLRGAYNALATLPATVRAGGVVASSAGNHGLGVAHAARILGLRARIFVPASAPAVKRDGILALGAEVDASAATYDDAHAAAVEYAESMGMPFVNPCAGAPLLAGQGTVALEILEALPTTATIVVPVGGGGLAGGMGAWIRATSPGTRLVGVQSEVTSAMCASLAAGRRVTVDVPPTLADGLAGQIDDEGLAAGQYALDEIRLVSEAAIRDAIAWLAHVHGAKVEGSGAVGVALLLAQDAPRFDGPVVVVLSGGNIDAGRWEAITAGGEAAESLRHSTA
ncbi:MAG: threonine/serine dehydratase [bacterium]